MRDSLNLSFEPPPSDEEYISHYAIFKRVDASLNRSKPNPFTRRERHLSWRDLPRLSFGNITLDTQTNSLVLVNPTADAETFPEHVLLTPNESGFLQLLMILSQPRARWGANVSKEEILDWLTVIREDRVSLSKKREKGVSGEIAPATVNAILYRLQEKLASLQGCLVSIDRLADGRLQLVTNDN